MKIVVGVKAVLNPSGIAVNRRAGQVTIQREEVLMDPAAKHALEAALRLKDALGAEVIALAVGAERAEDVLCQALGMGADQAIGVRDAALSRADAGVVTRALARAVEHIGGVALVLVGERALDTSDGQVGPRLAEALGWPLLSRALRLEVNGTTLRTVTQRGREYIAQEADLPAVVTIPRDSHPPRYAHAGRLLQAYRDGLVTTWSVADLGLDAASLAPLVQVRGAVVPPERELGVRLTGTAEEVAAKLAGQLYERLGLRR